MEEVKIGTISSIDKECGMISVIYEEHGETTEALPCANFNDEYKPPEIGAKVIVLQNGEGGIVLCGLWNEENPAPVTSGTYIKKLGNDAFIQYDDRTKTLTIKAENIQFKTLNGNINLSDIIAK